MADLGATSSVGLPQRLRTPASTYSSSFSARGTYSNFPVPTNPETDFGTTQLVVQRLVLPQVVRPAPQLVWYEMRGRDQDCATLTYRYWRVPGAPDLTGTSYTGPKCGANPLVEIVVLEADITG